MCNIVSQVQTDPRIVPPCLQTRSSINVPHLAYPPESVQSASQAGKKRISGPLGLSPRISPAAMRCVPREPVRTHLPGATPFVFSPAFGCVVVLSHQHPPYAQQQQKWCHSSSWSPSLVTYLAQGQPSAKRRLGEGEEDLEFLAILKREGLLCGV